MSILTPRMRRRLTAAAAAGALAAGGLALTATSAQASPTTTASRSNPVSDATFTWGLSDEQGGGAFFGGCNFLSAGTAGNTGSSRLWTEDDGFYKTADANVAVQKPTTAGEPATPSWATKCQTPSGAPVSAFNTASKSGNQVKIVAGKGSISTADNTAAIQWTGSFTSVFYGGLTYWSAKDPKLTVKADGTGTVTATASGYGADMEDSSKWVTLTPRTITLANLTNVDVTDAGLVVGGSSSIAITPSYLGVTVDVGDGSPQVTGNASSGSFPQSFVDFQQLTGQSSYWYSSGGARDAAKPAAPLTVGLTAAAAPTVTVSDTEIEADGTQTVTVTGQNFDPTAATGTRPPLLGRPGGSYIAFGKFADVWRASEGAASSARVALDTATKWAVLAADEATVGGTAAGAITLSPDGSFTTELTIDKAALDTKVAASAVAATLKNYGIYTYPGSGATQAAYETFTPLTFATVEPPAELEPGTFTAVDPSRLLDTRGGAKVSGKGEVSFQVTGEGGVPEGAGAVVLNVTATAPAAGGFVTAYPAGTTKPSASNLNFATGQTIANHVTVQLGTEGDNQGKVSLYNGSAGAVHLFADVAGWYAAGDATEPGTFTSVTPTRLLDTRAPAAKVAANTAVPVQVTGEAAGIPSGAGAAVLNLTVANPTKGGFITAFPFSTTRPNASNLNFVAGQTIPNAATVKLGDGGKAALHNGSAGTVNLLADVAGWFRAGVAEVPGAFTPLAPNRLLDTRAGVGANKAKVPAKGSVTLAVDRPDAGAAVLNVTVVNSGAAGFITAYPAGTTRPNASNLNFVAGQAIPNLVTVKLSDDGKVTFYNGSDKPVDLLADMAGWYRG